MEPSWELSLRNHGSYAKLVEGLRTIIFQIDFEGILKFRGSMRGIIDLGGSWRRLGDVLGRLGGV